MQLPPPLATFTMPVTWNTLLLPDAAANVVLLPPPAWIALPLLLLEPIW